MKGISLNNRAMIEKLCQANCSPRQLLPRQLLTSSTAHLVNSKTFVLLLFFLIFRQTTDLN